MGVNINPLKIPEEAYRLGKLGVLDISWVSDNGVLKTGKYIVVGFGVDGNENDCLMVAGPYGMSGKNIHRFIIVSAIRYIAVSETQSFNRYGKPVQVRPSVKPNSSPMTRLTEKDLEFLNAVENGKAND